MMSRAGRTALYAAATVLTVLFIGAYAAGVAVLLSGCGNYTGKLVVLCSHQGAVRFLALALLVVIVYAWGRFLASSFAAIDSVERDRKPVVAGNYRSTEAIGLGMGQTLISGTVAEVSIAGSAISVGDLRLTLWGGYALQRGWLVDGDFAWFVYQSFGRAKFVLAFCKGRDAPVQSVGIAIHVFCLILAASLAVLNASIPSWLHPLWVLLVIVSCSYLLLQFIAKRALREYVARPVSN